MDSLPESIDTTEILVSWSGEDDLGGSGLRDFGLYVSEDSGAFGLHQSNLTDTSLIFTGELEHTYGFFTLATDNAGNMEPMKSEAEATVFLGIPFIPAPPKTVTDLTIHYEFDINQDPSTFLTLRWSPVTEDTAGREITVDCYYVFASPSVDSEWTPVDNTYNFLS